MKRLNALLILLSFALLPSLNAQLADGSIAPNFTATDIEGNTWTLYDVLDSGKSVIIDFSATWCGPCWNYHTSGQMESLYEQYGPDGTDEMMVFMIEGDESTNLDCIYGPDNCNSTTYGDWTEGTKYPIINDGSFTEAYQIAYWPTIYHICQNRIVTEAPQLSTAEMYSMNDACAKATGANNIGILSYSGFEGTFCQEGTFAPSAIVQNLGTDVMSSAELTLQVNGNVTQTIDWTGTMNTFQIDEVVFDEITVTDDAVISISAQSVNGTADEDNSNDAVEANTYLGVSVDKNVYTLSILTDNYPGETYWEILDGNENILFWGGNQAVVNGNVTPYTNSGFEYIHEIHLPGDGCFEFNIYDAYGDGICCAEGAGVYTLTDSNGDVLFTGAEFGDGDFIPFSIEGNTTPISDNGAIAGHNGVNTVFCDNHDVVPQVVLQNLGNNDITSAGFSVSSSVLGEIGTFEWTGLVETGQYAFIDLDDYSIDVTSDISTTIVHINGEMDQYADKNEVVVTYENFRIADEEMNIEFVTDDYGYELYWDIVTSDGTILASGGNELVGPNGGGLRVATPNDPGAIGNNVTINETIAIPDNTEDCLSFRMVDDYGDGIGGGAYVKLTDSQGNEIFNRGFNAAFAVNETPFNALNGISNLTEIEGLSALEIFPNPATDELNLRFSLQQANTLNISVYNALGQIVELNQQSTFGSGTQYLKLDVSDLTEGLYYVKIENENIQISEKVTILK